MEDGASTQLSDRPGRRRHYAVPEPAVAEPVEASRGQSATCVDLAPDLRSPSLRLLSLSKHRGAATRGKISARP